MLLAIDVGNTQSVFALCQKGRIAHLWRMATEIHRSADEYAVLLNDMLQLSDFRMKDIKAVIISNVVPATEFALRQFSERYLNTKPHTLHEMKVPLKVDVDYPEEVGDDRLLNAYAAFDKYKTDCIVIDLGTATTFDIVREGTYIGGVISPGINLSLEALEAAAAKLPNIRIAKPPSVIGRNTVSAMQSGLYYGYIGLIEGMVRRIAESAKLRPKVVATGGLAGLLRHGTDIIDDVQDNLLIEGLMMLASHHGITAW